MRWAFVVLMAIHALIHLMGFVKSFGLARMPQLTQPISLPLGLVWLAATVSILAALVALFAWPRWWWAIGAVALIASQVAISSSWTDAKFGTVANVVLLVGVACGFFTQGPTSFRAAFEKEAATGLARVRPLPPAAVITEADLAPLPSPVQRYLRATGALGQPRVLSYRLRFRGRIRGGPSDAWMSFEADQQSFTDRPTRLFLMGASMWGLPVQAFHRFAGASAAMQVKIAGVVEIVDAHGPVMDRSETVTLFNDMCILAPGSLLSPSITWERLDDRTARAHFANGAQTISAVLHFDEEGLLTDFVSDDRSRASRDGRTFTPLRFSTPVRDYRPYGPVRLASHGEARWHAPVPEGEFTYGEFELLEISYDVR
jgi:hypothetical protein